MKAYANPYPDPTKVPQDRPLDHSLFPEVISYENKGDGLDVLRIQVDWEKNETYHLKGMSVEKSGTPGLYKSRLSNPEWGSFKGILSCLDGTKFYDSIGTGSFYRHMARSFTFRFPLSTSECEFSMKAENPSSGLEEEVLRETLSSDHFSKIPVLSVDTFLIKASSEESKIYINFYADGFKENRKAAFLKAAQRAVNTLEKAKFPGFNHFEFKAVFSASNKVLGKPVSLGENLPERDSFLGLYYPYWVPKMRWYHVVYPTREERFRNAIAQVAYDYPIALLDDNGYWGVGNYKELTAIPIDSSSFDFLLLHEFGHFFGLNEEYDGGGQTELEFALNIAEPWSQNLTFNTDKNTLKWKGHLFKDAPVPTPLSFWSKHYSRERNIIPIGAYKGGYGDSHPEQSYIPATGGFCTMSVGSEFCSVCASGIKKVIDFDRP